MLSSTVTGKTKAELAATLSTWSALEALSPATYDAPHDLVYGDRSRVIRFEDGPLPWTIPTKPPQGKQIFYSVVLGSMLMDTATKALIKVFGDDEARVSLSKKRAVAAEILLDKDGVVLAEKAITVSSFPWALPLALQLKLKELGNWPTVEEELQSGLDAIVHRIDSDSKPIPLDISTMEWANQWLVEKCQVPNGLIERPTFVLCHYYPIGSKTQPEALLLNSFFLHDLARVARHVKNETAPTSVLRYLGAITENNPLDVLKDKVLLEEAVAPTKTPAAKWPAGEGRSLVMLQQAAVNLVGQELNGKEGLLAVNGPPGTGKTTLLRDVVAMCVLERAIAMSAFDDPKDAFTKTEERVEAGKTSFDIYRLDDSLKGHEMLVASSNNKAVENVSKELPAEGAVSYSRDQLSYFKSISDLVHGPRKQEQEEAQEGITPEPVKTWGLIAAVLGNKGNRSAFWKAFWWNEDRSFRTYLKTVLGHSVLVEHRDPVTDIVEKRTPEVVLREHPPSSQQAKENWRKERIRFLAVKAEIDAELQALEEVRCLCLVFEESRCKLASREKELEILQTEHDELAVRVETLRKERDQASARYKQASTAWNRHKSSRPGLFARLARTDDARAWKEEADVWRRPLDVATRQLAVSEDGLKKAERARSFASAKAQVFETDLERERGQFATQSQIISEHRIRLGGRIVDEEKFQEGHVSWNQSTPWVTEALNAKRESLFIAALDLHHAFIDAAASKILHNLGALQVSSTGMQKNEEWRKLLGDLWSTLFLVVPVLSTTFASVERMLGDLPPSTLGWLLIDEAGQATPQSAVGAILRAKRTIAVGDPLQIQPVVSLPERLNADICDFFKVKELDWTAPAASTQTLVDRASRYQSSFEAVAGERRVGLPLLVHRRCQNPMFTISNKIAYAGQMVQVVGSRKLDVEDVLGPSTWIDVEGTADSKWSPAEGKAVIDLLTRLVSTIENPDVFVISPFRIVVHEMTRFLQGRPDLMRRFSHDCTQWLKDRVGTIHTFQGREADTVILLLGAPAESQNGAREWAARTPNILNVAVSRARQNLYVVGSWRAWSSVGLACHMSNELPNRIDIDGLAL
ncbi:DEAD/DEAH box helicase [Edaphobacter albus]|uniref:DEAD/DEAH box helicase n=1 Tax=Edaphobacter sp. 4G125 TaxID=2763071 RepID=UPI001646B34D|nr:DEAD/DEAH box helicase [Edaphobacter sp. 4G125]QNI35788.1 helicase [Edaphobacter sp. 4G125]